MIRYIDETTCDECHRDAMLTAANPIKESRFWCFFHMDEAIRNRFLETYASTFGSAFTRHAKAQLQEWIRVNA